MNWSKTVKESAHKFSTDYENVGESYGFAEDKPPFEVSSEMQNFLLRRISYQDPHFDNYQRHCYDLKL